MTLAPLRTGTQPVLDHAHHGEAPALLVDGAELSHAELADLAAARATSWGPGRRLVLVEGASHLDAVVAYLAALQHGHVALVVPEDRPAQREALVAAYDPDVVCVAGSPDDVRREQGVHDLHPDLALLLSTSGTTGSPKLVRLSRRNVASNAAAIADYLGLRADDRAVTSLPLHYCYGLSVLHSHLVAGASIALTGLSVVDACFWDLVERARVTGLAGVPHTFDLLGASGFEQRDLPHLRRVTQAGGRLAPGEVLRWSRVGREHGWDLVVMYGQTEATARMAWLPPDLLEDHPGSIGVAIPGGDLHLDESVDDRPGVGEIVYSGPNVMMGYATSPDDLALPAGGSELRTGDLGRCVDGVFEVVGRRNRVGKVFGLRLDLEAIERRVQSDADPQARVVATASAVHVFLPAGRRARAIEPAVRALVGEHCGLPAHAVRSEVVAELPLTAAGKVDYAALAARGEETERHETAAAEVRARVRDDVALVLGLAEVRDDDSFVGLGGDSLSYVELATRLTAHFPRGLPTGWPTLAMDALERRAADQRADATRTPDRRPGPVSRALARTTGWTRLETTIALRAVAILLVVGSHVDLVALEGGAHLLLALAGFNFARFQLSAPGGPTDRLRTGLAGLAQLVVPSMLWIGAVGLAFGTYHVTTALFVRELVDSREWDDQWQFWFLEALVWLTVAALALTCVPALHRAERRSPFRFALIALAVTAAARFAEVGLRAGPTERYTTMVVAFFFVLGWAGARATAWHQRALVSVVAALLTVGFFGQPHREAIVLVGFWLMLWLPHVRLPSRAARAAGVLAGASLFIYLTHWQVYPPLEDAGHQWLALVASLTVGIAYARLARPMLQGVGRVVRGSR